MQRVSMLFLASTLVCAAQFGAPYGILGAALGTIAFACVNSDAGSPPVIGGRQDLANLIVYTCGACIVGFYRGEVLARWESVWRLAADTPVASDSAQERNRLARARILEEGSRLAEALVIAAASTAIAVGLSRILGVERVSAIYMAAVVASAVILGARFGIVTAVACVVAFDYFHVEPRYTLQLQSTQALVNLIVFTGMGWWVGAFAERVRHESGVARALFGAGRTLSATASPTDLAAVICEAVTSATRGLYVEVEDETGARLHTRGAPAAAPSADPELRPGETGTAAKGRRRVRRLVAAGRDYGCVRWLRPATLLGADAPIDRTVDSLVDLGAAALARARASRETAALEARAETDQFRDALLASVSHDIRTPLSGILGAATSLIDYFHVHERRVTLDLLQNIREQAHRLNRYVEDILSITRLQSGRLAPRVGAHRIEPLLFETWQVLLDSGRGQHLRFDIPEDLEACIDPGLFRHAFGNVLENAMKYSAPESPLEIVGVADAAEVCIVVRDGGPGVPPEQADQMFDAFVRGDVMRAAGAGLGLYIARTFIEAMQGSISAHPRADGAQGLEVRLALRPAGAQIR